MDVDLNPESLINIEFNRATLGEVEFNSYLMKMNVRRRVIRGLSR